MEVAKTLQVPLTDVHGVIEFYSLFYNKLVGIRIILLCTDQVCALNGADSILEHHCRHYDIQPGQATSSSR
jgi:NADH:ubiquinone oxidoreductase subunit E